MQALELFVALVGHLAWPVALLLVALKFAPTIRQVAARASKLKIGDAEIELAQRLEEVREIAAETGLTILLPSGGIQRRAYEGPVGAIESVEARTGSRANELPDPFEAPPAPPPAPSPSPRLAQARDVAASANVTRWVFDSHGPKTAKTRLATDTPGLYLSSVWADLEGQIRSLYRQATGSETFTYDDARQFLVGRGVLDPALARLLDALRSTRNDVVHARSLDMTPAEAAEWGGIALTLSQRIDQRARMLGVTPGA